MHSSLRSCFTIAWSSQYHQMLENEHDGRVSVGILPGWIRSSKSWAIELILSRGTPHVKQVGGIATRLGSRSARIPASGPWLEVNRGGRYPFLKVSHGFEDHSLRHHLRSAPILPAALRTARSHVPHCPSSISSRNVFAQRRLGEPLVVCAMVGALIFLARPNWPMIQIP